MKQKIEMEKGKRTRIWEWQGPEKSKEEEDGWGRDRKENVKDGNVIENMQKV